MATRFRESATWITGLATCRKEPPGHTGTFIYSFKPIIR
ncbi:hypothetical protein M135_5378 [Bacteroides fragilis str. S36L5]|uniref:Uncharacterized protein n=2 Tax=Bacteroides TaxID=816 RepID=A0A016AG94_BACFG|nr:hypothetical protein BACUNI_02528 [Bacteroides uniformis ATCC 8492]EXZ27441.1 hypothetical protein M136_3408 [Bacteroides fragilis str. S36L11]EYA84097.1 hypothetical protein M137_4140 [Bacteroides fragilis str. S36L12]EYA93445.1 hypothetical protein M135_5378 [Bacteroides fragilis str. S36L5]